MTSSILPPRSALAPCSPSTQLIASTTFDLPEPLGPTTHVMPGSKRRVVDDANDLKPRSVRLFRYMDGLSRTDWGSPSPTVPGCLDEGTATRRDRRQAHPIGAMKIGDVRFDASPG